MQVVVVGAGLGGLRTVEELRRAGHTGGLSLVGEEADHPYDRPPLSKQALQDGTAPPPLRPVEDYAELDALHGRLADQAVYANAGVQPDPVCQVQLAHPCCHDRAEHPHQRSRQRFDEVDLAAQQPRAGGNLTADETATDHDEGLVGKQVPAQGGGVSGGPERVHADKVRPG